MIYFDNGATSGQRPLSILNSTMSAIKNLSANPGRSGHKTSLSALKMITNTRERLANFFGLGSEYMQNVIFTKNCTEALNLAIMGTAGAGGHVITTANEHNSTLRPLFELEKLGLISLTILEPNSNGVVTHEDIEKAITKSTYLVAMVHSSNVTGATCDLKSVGKLCKEKNILFLVDSAQSAGHIDINMTDCNIDMLAFAGHKGLLGIAGIGGLIFTCTDRLTPILYGGTGTDSESPYQPTYSPEGFESGTLNTPGIASLNASLTYIQTHFKRHNLLLEELTTYTHNKINNLNTYKIYSYKNACGIVTFKHDYIPSTEISQILGDKYDIATRSGLHCAPLIHKHLNTTEEGLVRVSLSPFNTRPEVDRLIIALKQISNSHA